MIAPTQLVVQFFRELEPRIKVADPDDANRGSILSQLDARV